MNGTAVGGVRIDSHISGHLEGAIGLRLAMSLADWPTRRGPYTPGLVPSHVGELGEVLEEGQPGHAGGPVPVLGHDDLGGAALV
jgi:hypothetical protein